MSMDLDIDLDEGMPRRIYLEPGAPYSMIATQLALDTGMKMTSDRSDAGLVLLEEETAQRIIRTHGWVFHPRARLVYLPGMLFVEDKCKLAHLLSGAPYHPETMVETASREQISQSRRWIEKRGLGANGQDVRIVDAAALLSSPSGGGWERSGHVLQKYEEDVLLFEGRKFDLRVHAIMLADGRFAIHRDALVRRCARPYSTSDTDPASQITNMSVQKRFDPTLRTVTTTLNELPSSLRAVIAPQILACIADLLTRFRKQTARAAAEEALGGKILSDHLAFRMFGVDILPLRSGTVKVLEVNYRPAINLTGCVAPFYRSLIRWMGRVLLSAESPELTLPHDMCESAALTRLHPLAYEYIRKTNLRLVSSPRLEIEIERQSRLEGGRTGESSNIFVNREWALRYGRDLKVQGDSSIGPGWIAVDLKSRSVIRVTDQLPTSMYAVWFGSWIRCRPGYMRFVDGPRSKIGIASIRSSLEMMQPICI
jgi:hypothetical protein